MKILNDLAPLAGRILVAGLLPLSLIYGGLFIIVDISLRGVNTAIQGVQSRMDDIARDIDRMQVDIQDLKVDIAALDANLSTRLDSVDARLERIGYKLPEEGNINSTPVTTLKISYIDEIGNLSESTVDIPVSGEYDNKTLGMLVTRRLSKDHKASGPSILCSQFNFAQSERHCSIISENGKSVDITSVSGISTEIISDNSFTPKEAIQNIPLRRPISDSSTTFITEPSSADEDWSETWVTFSGSKGTAIRATASGIVVFVGRQRGRQGVTVEIRHEFGFESLYSSLLSASVSLGDRVNRGDQIGIMGGSTEPDRSGVSYQVRINGEAISPQALIEAGDRLEEIAVN